MRINISESETGGMDRGLVIKAPPTFSTLSILRNPLNKRLSRDSDTEVFLYVKKKDEMRAVLLSSYFEPNKTAADSESDRQERADKIYVYIVYIYCLSCA